MNEALARQTRTFLMERFRQAGIRPKTQHGQNFLIDLNLLEILFKTGDIGPDDVVLEVGSGTGSLTAMMAPVAAHVISVEIDPQLAQLAREQLFDIKNITLLQQDALKNKNNMHPRVLDIVREKLAEAPGRRLKLVANLPYNVATPVISNLLREEPLPVLMAVTIQKEVGERMAAAPATSDYGALSIWLQSQCDIEVVRIMPPTVFWPQPKIESAIMKITFRPDLRARIPDVEFFHTFTRAIFCHRRKFLRSELISAFGKHLTKPEVDEVMVELQFDGMTRAETLSVEQMLALAEAMRRRVQKPEPGRG